MLYTIGYEKRQFADFINALLKFEVDVLVDIRAIPHSRNGDYAKRNLELRLKENGISYLLIKELGSPKELRKKVKSDGDYGYFFEKYNAYLDGKSEYIKRLIDIAEKKTICLLCYEADFNRCHRKTVADRIAESSKCIDISHL
jgi:uncharacterized protein (DUF488 family)